MSKTKPIAPPVGYVVRHLKCPKCKRNDQDVRKSDEGWWGVLCIACNQYGIRMTVTSTRRV
jgi:hypothetical protein